ncbi:MAG: hypothetical protein LC754_19620, partial [Acidobacteria bacterium]|nr:hypothetical protein [Acidobacteriota bacterium]
MKALLAALSIALGATIALTLRGGATAVLLCAVCAIAAGVIISRVNDQKGFLLQVFAGGLIVRVFVGTLIFAMSAQDFFGGDAKTYDFFGYALLESWRGDLYHKALVADWSASSGSGWGMPYLVAGMYYVVGRNMLAVQFFNAVVGAATAPVIFLCAR